MDKDIRDTWKAAFGGDKARRPSSPFDGREFIDPREFNDWLKKPCAVCGLPTVQQYRQVSHRGNFRNGGHKIVVAPVGQVCKCGEGR